MKRRRRPKVGEQLELDVRPPPTHGGKRPGAGRPRKTENRSPHERRPELSKHHPVHVSLRVVKEVGRLRRPAAYAAIQRAIAACAGRPDFRIVHTSIQGNHIHLLVESDDKIALENGIRAFMVSAAQHLNNARGRKGTVFPTRYHAVQLTTPKQVRNALAYCLNNWRRHREDLAGPRQRGAHVDPYSSGILFDGWDVSTPFLIPDNYSPLPVRGPSTWLLRVGWRKHHPLIGLREGPGPIGPTARVH
jgi:REP element-mobilizing transposase RayT